MEIRPLNDYERFCHKIIDCIKFIKKHGHMAKSIYLDYEDKLVNLNAKTEENITYEDLQDYIIITQDELYPFMNNIKESSDISFASWIRYMATINNAIDNKNIVIKYDLLTYEERIAIQKVLSEYLERK